MVERLFSRPAPSATLSVPTLLPRSIFDGSAAELPLRVDALFPFDDRDNNSRNKELLCFTGNEALSSSSSPSLPASSGTKLLNARTRRLEPDEVFTLPSLVLGASGVTSLNSVSVIFSGDSLLGGLECRCTEGGLV